MKNICAILLLLATLSVSGQISVQGRDEGSITITSKGFQGKSNSVADGENLALGSNALKNNIVGASTGTGNTAVGDSSMFANTSGFVNTALGAYTLQNNTSGPANTAVGYASLYRNLDGTHNSGFGNLSLHYNTAGIRNTAIGNSALFRNTTASFNTAVGNWALFKNNTGSFNTAVGSFALRENLAEGNTAFGMNALQRDSLGTYNTAIGLNAGRSIKNGGYCTFVGFEANSSTDSLFNATAIGYGAIVDASNKVRIGDAGVSVIEGQVAWSNPSDRRLKENILYTNRLGLDFINNLQTVSYNYIADENKTRYDGFIAQDIEKLMVNLGMLFSGLKKSDDGMLSLAYSDFVMPLVNAIQEQQKEIEALKKQVQETMDLKTRLERLEERMLN